MAQLSVRVRLLTGREFSVQLSADLPIESICTDVATHLNTTAENVKLTKGFKVLDHRKAAKDQIAEGDVLIATLRRAPQPASRPPTAVTSPTKEEVAAFTRTETDIDERTRADEFAASIRDLVATLTGSTDADVDPTAGELPLELPAIDETVLSNLTEMGFPEERCRKALYLNRMRPDAAMEYLLTHAEDADIDAPLTAEQVKRIAIPSQGARAGFKAHPAAVRELVGMGFSEAQALEALRTSNNDLEGATAYLLGESNVATRIDADHPLIGAILSNPTVQVGLTNARVLQALHEMVEDPQRSIRYMNDPEIGPVLVRIHSIMSRQRGGRPAASGPSAGAAPGPSSAGASL